MLYLYNILFNTLNKKTTHLNKIDTSKLTLQGTDYYKPTKPSFTPINISANLLNINNLQNNPINQSAEMFSFLNTLGRVVTYNIENGYNYYIFSRLRLKSHWNLDLGELFIKSKSVIKFKKILSYYFYKNKINVVVCLDFSFFKLLQVLKNVNIIRVGILTKKHLQHNFHYYLLLKQIDGNLVHYVQ